MLKRLLVCLLTAYSFIGISQKDYALSIVDSLCSPRYHGRGYVNEGDLKAARFLVDELKSIGVSAFPEKSFTQDYAFSVNTFPHKIEVILGEDTLVPGQDYLVSPISGSAQGEFDVVEINKETFFKTFNGNINFKKMDPSQTVFVFNFSDTLDKNLRKRMKSLSYEACMYFPSIYVTNEKLMYSVGRKYANYPHIEIDSAAYSKVEKAKLTINNKFIPSYYSRNVIGFVPGKKKKKYIVLTAHYDHLGRMGPDTYFPGANDNASGVAMLLSLAKYYMENKPKYSMVFCFFSGEEAGLLGSKHFVENAYFPLKKVKMVFNIDIMGGAGDGVTLVNGKTHAKLFKKIEGINKDWNLIPKIGARGSSANSDHYFFSEQGVPAFFMYSVGSVKNYHDIYDTAENTPLTNFDEVEELVRRFLEKL